MSFSIRFDYRYDSSGFFDDPVRRAALEAAAAEWAKIIQDDFAEVPSGTTFSIRNPSNLAIESVTLTEPIDDILVFVGARAFPSATLAIAGPDGGDAPGDVFAARISSDFRNQGAVSDFEPWAGFVSFNSAADWSFDISGPVSGRSDFLSVALHELGHVLGIGTSGAFDRWISDNHFTGPNALRLGNGDPIPLEEDHAHVKNGYADDSVALDPILINGTRVLISDIDKALLADIGYQISGFQKQGVTPSLTTNQDERVFGSNTDDRIEGLDGNDSLQGADGNDHLLGGSGADDLFGQSGNDTIEGGFGDDYLDGGSGNDILIGGPGADVSFGHDGHDIFVVGAGHGSNRLPDFDLATDLIRLVDSGFASTEDALSAISKPFNNVSRMTLTDGTTLDVFHDSQDGTPLTARHIMLDNPEVQGPATPAIGDATDEGARVVLSVDDGAFPEAASTLIGTDLDDVLIVEGSQVLVDGLAGKDTVLFSGNQSDYTVTLGRDGATILHRTTEQASPITLQNVEAIDFETRGPQFEMAFDLSVFAGHASLDQETLNMFIELYVAYFNRAPDAVGLGFWASTFAEGTSLETIAALFAEQTETAALYPEDMTTFSFVSAVYENVLGRAPDWDGLRFWSTALENGTVTRSGFILDLLEGAKANLPVSADADLIERQANDQAYLSLKTGLGAYFALELGLSDIASASDAMLVFDGSRSSFDTAIALVDEVYQYASNPESGAFLMPLLGVSDDMTLI